MKLSVIILNYNVRYFLELCLKSVEAAIGGVDAEIIVVDNHSDDDSCDMVKQLFPEVILIQNNENYGFSRGNNIGVARAKGEFICILNPDTVVAEDTFRKLIDFTEGKEKLGVVGCKLINGAGHFLPESKRNIPYVHVALKKILGFPKDYYANHLSENDLGEAEILVGAFMWLKRQVFNEIGGFDEDYFMYGEDIDLSFRALQQGYKNYYFGKTSVIHFKGESTLRDKHYLKRFYHAMQIFYTKHFKKYLVLDLVVWLGIKLAFWLNSPPHYKKGSVKNYILISKHSYLDLRKRWAQKLKVQHAIGKPESGAEVILDVNDLSFKDSISFIETHKNNKNTFKLLLPNSRFMLGSNDAGSRGEVICF